MDEDGQIDALADEITNYLRAHPNAADTIDGVMNWWLRDMGRTQSMRRVQQALDRLVEQEYLRSQDMAGGSRLYFSGPRLSGRA